MTDLSPAAQAVMGAFGTYPLRADHISEDLIPALAAALRAAADQVLPLEKTPWGTTLIPLLTSRESRDRLLAIAAELESQ